MTQLAEQIADALRDRLILQGVLAETEIAVGGCDPGEDAQVYLWLPGYTPYACTIEIYVQSTDITIDFSSGRARRTYVVLPLDDASQVQLALGGTPEINIPEVIVTKVAAGIRAQLDTHNRLAFRPSDCEDEDETENEE